MSFFLSHFISHNAKKFYIEISTYLKFGVNIFDNFLIPISPLEVQMVNLNQYMMLLF